MARGTVFDSFYVSNSFVLGTGESTPGSLASFILSSLNIPYRNIAGSPLSGYDVKSQDATNLVKLSLLAEVDTSGEIQAGAFPEVYCGPDGIATKVLAGQEIESPGLIQCFLKNSSNNFISKVDHVLVKGKQPLPTRYYSGSVNVMGNGIPNFYQFNCITGYPTKNPTLATEAWAEFERSTQSKETLDQLKLLARRSLWESLVGYKVTFPDIPRYASFSLSQSTPKILNVPFTSGFNTSLILPVGESLPDGGGIVDISGLSAVGASVLDLVKGSDLLSSFPQLSTETSFDFDDTTYYCLLSDECGLLSISRGTNWFLLPAGDDFVNIILRRGGASKAINEIFNGFDYTVEYFRRKDGSIESISDMISTNIQKEGEPFPAIGAVANYNPFRGEIVAGLGGSNGIEMTSLELSYSISKPSIAVKSTHGDAPTIASQLASHGIIYSAIVVKDAPGPTGWNGQVVYPVSPPDEEGTMYEVDSLIDELEGTVVDMSAPWLGEQGVASLSSKIYGLINGDAGRYVSVSYKAGGYWLLPGMRIPEGVIQTIEFNYNDQDSMSTNINTGPLYYPVGSFPDSKYIKRTESFSRDAWVVAGSNRDGVFIVDVEGLGRYEAINGGLDSIYPGDKVEVRLANVPVERD